MKNCIEQIGNNIKFKNIIFNEISKLKDNREYVEDELLKNYCWDIFWALSDIRRFQTLFYPLNYRSSCLVMNDYYGSLTGSLCDRISDVSFLASFDNSEVIKKRYSTRDNLTIVKYNEEITKKYDYVFVNLEYDEFYLYKNMKFSFDCIKEDGIILCSINRTHYQKIKNIVFNTECYFKSYDIFDNGMLTVEIAKKEVLLAKSSSLDFSAYKKKCDGYLYSPLLYSKWIRYNTIPFFDNMFYSDQDYEKIQSVKMIQIDLLAKLREICQKHELKLYPIYGTLLGLMRDGGYIKGDDDIDVALMRSDYDKLMTLSSEFTGKYFLQTPESDNCFFGGYSKLRNRETSAIHPQNWWADCCEGIGIDIFPIDRASINRKKEKRRLKNILFMQRMLYAYSYGNLKDFLDMKMLKWKMYKYIGKLIHRDKMIDFFNLVLKQGNSNSRFAIYTHYKNGCIDNQIYISGTDLERTFILEYEGIPLDVPCGWDNILSTYYGKNYFSVPCFNEFKRRHGFYDVSIPYEVYKKRFTGLKNPGSIKEPVILFGDGSLFKACLEYYNSRVHITHLVLLPGEKKTISSIMNIPVYSFDEFQNLRLEKKSYRGIICSGDAMLADAVLSENGYTGLYIFWHNRDWMLFANQSAIWKCIGEMQ